MVRVRATYLVATLALLVAFPFVVAVLTPSPSALSTWIVLGVFGAIAALLLVHEARRDSYALAQFAVVSLLFPGTFAVAAYVVAETSAGRMRAIAAATACLIGIAGAVYQLWKEHRIEDVGVNVLLARFDKGSIFEIDGVQWAVERGGDDVGRESWIKVFLQSCVAAERSVTIELEDVAGLLGRRGSLTTPPLEAVTLGPGDVGGLLIPVRPGPRPAEEAWLYVSVQARGAPGRRLRRFRGQTASGRTKRGFQLFALLGGYLVWGGGVRCRFVNRDERAGSESAPPATWQSIGPGPADDAARAVAAGAEPRP